VWLTTDFQASALPTSLPAWIVQVLEHIVLGVIATSIRTKTQGIQPGASVTLDTKRLLADVHV
jgi:hypothetical protein